jgi:hypothetical protein
MDFNKLQAVYPSDPCAVDYQEQTLTFTFDHNKVTTRRFDEMQHELQDGGISALADFLASVLIEWDMTNDGKPAPITYEFLVELPQPLVSGIFQAVMQATGGGKQPHSPQNGSRPTSQERRRLARAGR